MVRRWFASAAPSRNSLKGEGSSHVLLIQRIWRFLIKSTQETGCNCCNYTDRYSPQMSRKGKKNNKRLIITEINIDYCFKKGFDSCRQDGWVGQQHLQSVFDQGNFGYDANQSRGEDGTRCCPARFFSVWSLCYWFVCWTDPWEKEGVHMASIQHDVFLHLSTAITFLTSAYKRL